MERAGSQKQSMHTIAPVWNSNTNQQTLSFRIFCRFEINPFWCYVWSMRMFLLLLTTLFSLGCNYPPKPMDTGKPNVLLILVDDLGKEWISCYGAQNIKTPHIDQLASEGMLFHNAYSMPQCTPTRVTLLTGQYPFRHGWVNHWDVPRWGGGAHFDETENPSLGVEMKRAGYVTAIAGKWQIDDFRVEPDALSKNGFDHWCMWTGYETGIPASGKRYQDPYIFTQDGSKTYHGTFGPDVFKDYLIEFIQANRDTSFFIYYPMVLTHTPFVNTPDETAETDLGKHRAMVRYTDKITGELIQALEAVKVRENTLIIWTTDNGTSGKITGALSGSLVKGGKAQTTEPGICAPFIANWTKEIPPASTTNALIDFTDLFPTFLDLAGIPPSRQKEQFDQIDGKSFKQVLLGKSDSSRDWILSMGGGNQARLTDTGVENQFSFRDRVLRNEQYKLYINAHREPEKFIDLLSDPGEEIDLLDSLQIGERLTHFEALFNIVTQFPEKDADPRYIPNPPQPWDVQVTAKSQVWKQ